MTKLKFFRQREREIQMGATNDIFTRPAIQRISVHHKRSEI